MINSEKYLEAVSKFGSPLYLYDKNVMMKSVSDLLKSLPPSSKLLYSVKANPNPSILNFFSNHGVLFEVASEGELRHLLNSGICPQDIVFSGQAKSIEGISLAVKNDVRVINVESCREILDVVECCKKSDKKQSVMIRVNPKLENSSSKLKMGGVASPYGIDEEQLECLFADFNYEFISVEGLFMYAGSQFFDEDTIIKNTEYLISLSNKIHRKFGLQIRMIDFGGGFGIPEDISEKPLNLKKLHSGLMTIFTRYIAEMGWFRAVKDAFFESGRFLVAKSCILITKIIDIKLSRGIKYVILDSGINNLGIKQYPYRTFEPIINVLKNTDADLEEVVIVGPTCTPIDIVHSKAKLPKLSIGDFLAIDDCGAYSAYFSPVFFCGHDMPAEVVYDASMNLFIQIRERGNKHFACGYGFTNNKF
jgi:diaminopimelate decarboxylase/L-glutamyl-[BtrI acyl-carrier protein] decarboxylase